MAASLEYNWIAVKRILRYLKGSLYRGLHLSLVVPTISLPMRVFCDAKWAIDTNDGKSTFGIVQSFTLTTDKVIS